MIYPTKEEFLDLKRNSASYIPVKLEMNADLMTPIGLFYSLKGEKFLLERRVQARAGEGILFLALLHT